MLNRRRVAALTVLSAATVIGLATLSHVQANAGSPVSVNAETITDDGFFLHDGRWGHDRTFERYSHFAEAENQASFA
jgi:hypothetical protein